MESLRWRPWTRIQPSRNGAVLSHAGEERRVEVNRDALARILAEDSPESSPHARELARMGFMGSEESAGSAAAKDWHDKDWTLSLPFFLASRVTRFADDGDDRFSPQERVVREYLQRDGEPQAPPVLTECARELPPPAPLPATATGTVLERRVAAQKLPLRDLPLEIASGILWHGLAELRACRLAPSSLGPRRYLFSFGSAFDVVLVALRVSDLEPGVYAYDPASHRLEIQQAGNFGEQLLNATAGQAAAREAALSINIIADFPRYQWRYRHERALRNLYVDAGRLAQYLILATTAYRRALHMTPALRDGMLQDWFGLRFCDQQVLYTLSLA